MVHIKAFKGAEICWFEIDPGTTFGALKELVCKLFSLGEDVTVAINYRDRDGNLIMLSSDEELQTALRHLGEEETWHLQVMVQHKQQQQQQHDIAPRVPGCYLVVGLGSVSFAWQSSSISSPHGASHTTSKRFI